MYDAIIIGAGPAGLTSALYLLRANKNVLIFEAKSYGGQIINSSRVENYPAIESITGYEFATRLYNQVKKLGANIVYETVVKVDEDKTVYTNKGKYQAKAIIIATGSTNKKLNLPNEEKYIGKGISYCATCDGHFFKDKTVAVYGGGNSALEDVLYLSNLVNKVYLIHRSETLSGDAKYLDEINTKNNIEILNEVNIENINGDNTLESITLNVKEEIKELKIDGLFIAIGQEPRNQVFSNLVSLNDMGYIKTENDVCTKYPGIYVAGDTREKSLRQLTTAVSDGSIAATYAIRDIRETEK